MLKRTLGVPLFQEQLLRMAMIVAGFSGGEAEELRRALGFKRSEKRMREVEAKLRAGMTQNGITGAAAGHDRSVHHFVRAVWISRIARRQLRACSPMRARILKCHYLAAFHRRDAEQSADGLLSPGDAGERRAAARLASAADRCHAIRLGVHR